MAEAASPVEAVQAVTHEPGAALGASSVSFLIADLSGRALVRLTHSTDPDDETNASEGDRHTDLFEWGQRSTPFSLPAEIQRRLLPAAFTCESGAFTLSAWLEPAANVGGDAFDYSLGRDVLHLSMTDAMGHGVASALTATLCVGSLRNTRRQGASLLDQAQAANTALSEYGTSIADEAYATGLFGRLDPADGPGLARRARSRPSHRGRRRPVLTTLSRRAAPW